MKRSREEAFGAGVVQHKRNRRSARSLEVFSDEILLQIFSHLDAKGVCRAQALNKRFAALATDQLLWKDLYQQRFARSRRRGTMATTNGDDLPLRQLGHIGARDKLRTTPKNWKNLYHVRSNWERGRCKSTTHAASEVKTFVLGRTYEFRDQMLFVDKELHEFAPLKTLEAVYEIEDAAGSVLIVSGQVLYAYNVCSRKVHNFLSIPTYQTLVYHKGVLALLSNTNALFLYKVDEGVCLLESFQGPTTSNPHLSLRSLKPYIVVSLIHTNHGILDTSLTLQELFLSHKSRALVKTRVATSDAFPSLRHRGRDRAAYAEVRNNFEDRLLYQHPFVLAPVQNYIHVFDVVSTLQELQIKKSNFLWGYGSTIESCNLNGPFRLVIGSGNTGVRFWDLASDKIDPIGYGLLRRKTSDPSSDTVQERSLAEHDETSFGKIIKVKANCVTAKRSDGSIRTLDFSI